MHPPQPESFDVPVWDFYASFPDPTEVPDGDLSVIGIAREAVAILLMARSDPTGISWDDLVDAAEFADCALLPARIIRERRLLSVRHLQHVWEQVIATNRRSLLRFTDPEAQDRHGELRAQLFRTWGVPTFLEPAAPQPLGGV